MIIVVWEKQIDLVSFLFAHREIGFDSCFVCDHDDGHGHGRGDRLGLDPCRDDDGLDDLCHCGDGLGPCPVDLLIDRGRDHFGRWKSWTRTTKYCYGSWIQEVL